MHFLSSLMAHLGHVLAGYGGFGLFAINFLDSSFLFFPVINDLLLLHLSARHPEYALLYALWCTVGSVLGAVVLFWLARTGHRLWRKPSEQKVGRARAWMKRNEFVSILIASLLPPPTPFKVFPIAAGALRMKYVRFIVALLLGRGLRFGAEAVIAMRYGRAAEVHLRHHMMFLTVATIVVVLLFTIVSRWYNNGKEVTTEEPAIARQETEVGSR